MTWWGNYCACGVWVPYNEHSHHCARLGPRPSARPKGLSAEAPDKGPAVDQDLSRTLAEAPVSSILRVLAWRVGLWMVGWRHRP
jgi:hypothetical protein